jgi:DNA-binding NtrC family response regulator
VHESLRVVVERDGRELLSATHTASVVEAVTLAQVDLVIVDGQLAGQAGFGLLEAVRARHPEVLTVFIAAPGESGAAVQAFDRGACATLKHPLDAGEVLALVHRLALVPAPLEASGTAPAAVDTEAAPSAFHGMYGATPAMRDVYRRIARVGRTDVTVLVTGESGTGKELVARALHEESPRRHKPFIALNCSALPSELVESELFGHTRGAFTGAVKDRGGLFEAANGGTLFLDEIGDLGLLAQAKVLRVLENGEVTRVGDTRATQVDVRVITATHRPLDEMVADGRFREDLLYRLKVITLALPALRRRKDDIPLLARHFLRVFAERHGLPVRGLSSDAREVLRQYDWPGNVRELRNVLEGAVVLCDGPEIAVCDLPSTIGSAGPREACLSPPVGRPVPGPAIDEPFVKARERALREFDRAYLAAALARHGGNIARTARAIGLHRQSLQKLLSRRDLRSGELSPPE